MGGGGSIQVPITILPRQKKGCGEGRGVGCGRSLVPAIPAPTYTRDI
jgi:hypothetical protein